MINKILLIKKLNCYACDIVYSNLRHIIDKYDLDVKLDSRFKEELTEEELNKYNVEDKFPVINFIQDDNITLSSVGSYSRHALLEDIKTAFSISSLLDASSTFTDINDLLDSGDN